MINLYRHICIILLAGMIFLSIGCKKLVEVQAPGNGLIKDVVYSNDQAAIGVLNNIFIMVSGGHFFNYGMNCVPLITGLSSDELSLGDLSMYNDLAAFFQNNIEPQVISKDVWTSAYDLLYKVNDAIEGVTMSTTLTPHVKTQLLGEAKFLRAFIYFYLSNLYGKVGLVTSTDYKKNSTVARANIDKVYEQIVTDLKDAELLLSEQFLDGSLTHVTTEKVRPTKWAAKALLAKVYLYNKVWDLAEAESADIINKKELFDLDSLNTVFLKNSREAIWQAQPSDDIFNTFHAIFYIIPDGYGPNYVQPTFLNNRLLNAFETGDLRKEEWTKSSTVQSSGIVYSYPYKYKAFEMIDPSSGLTEYYMMLRLGEQYLIRAEARAEQGKFSDALEDLKVIRKRAGLPGIEATSKTEIIDAILHERQVELFTEWGDRWFDLRRMDKIDSVMEVVAPEKGGEWLNYKKYFPIKTGDLLANSNLSQTDGYK